MLNFLPAALSLYVRATWRAFFAPPGARTRLTVRGVALRLLFIPLFLVAQAFHWFGFLLDDLFFRGWRDVEVREPVFVLGIPRSGTTFLHRVLARDPRCTTFRTWECLFGLSVSARLFWIGVDRLDRAIGAPLGRLLEAVQRRLSSDLDDVHQVGLQAPEEDYFSLTPLMGCFILILPFPHSEAVWRMGRFDTDVPERQRRRIMAFYEACIKKHLYVRGVDRRFLSKNAAFASLTSSLCRTFPDCRILCCMRDPVETVPSQLSSLAVGRALFGDDPREARFRDRIVDLLEHYYHHLLDVLPALPDSRYAFVRMAELKTDVGGWVRRAYTRLRLPVDEAFAEALEDETRRARSFRSGHRYRASDYGLDEDGIRERFAPVYERYDFAGRGLAGHAEPIDAVGRA